MMLRCEAHSYGKEASFRPVINATACQEDDGMGDCCEKAGWIQCDVASLPTKQLGWSVISVATREIISSRTAHVVIFWGKQGIDCN